MSLLDISAIGLQIGLPLILLTWLALRPLSSRLGFLAHALFTGLVLLSLLTVSLWMIPPWWTPYLYLALWLGIMIWRAPGRFRRGPLLPGSVSNWMVVALFSGLGILAARPVIQGMQGRALPSERTTIDIAFPMGPGIYLVANGGATSAVNGHFLTLHPNTERQAAYRGQSYAVDLIKIDEWGLRAPGWRPTDPAAYRIFGEPVYAPCRGIVIASDDGMPDMVVPTTDTSRLEGNHVLIQCDDYAVLLAHFRLGSVSVSPGDQVTVGQHVGDAGNSGQSTEPHLHVHVQRLPGSGPLLSGEPLFLTFDGRFPVRNDRLVIETAPTATTP
ncbi:MAG: M23 family metallopeptidase [Parvibaculaceae bacterium]